MWRLTPLRSTIRCCTSRQMRFQHTISQTSSTTTSWRYRMLSVVRSGCPRCLCTTSCIAPLAGQILSPSSHTSPCCLSPQAAVSSRSAMATRWASPYSLCSGHHPQARHRAATARMATLLPHLSICCRSLVGTPAPSRRYSLCRSLSRPSRSTACRRREHASSPTRQSGSTHSICTTSRMQSSHHSCSPS